MATRTLKLILTSNLQVGDVITYRIYKKGGGIIKYDNTVSIPYLKIAATTSAINNIGIGATKEETTQNLYNVLVDYNYSAIGVSYSYTSGEDNITIEIDDSDGYDHVINNIFVPTNVIVATASPCDTAYIYNDETLTYNGVIALSIDGVPQTPFNSPKNFVAEITRNMNFTYSAATFNNYTVNIPESIQDPNDVILSQTNTSIMVTLPSNTNSIYSNYRFKLNDQPWQNSRVLVNLIENSLNTILIMDIWGCETTLDFVVNNLDYGFTNYPQRLTPVYNPVMYNFILPNYQATGFRYLINVKDEISNETISKFKITPQIDGSGYVDLSKILSNFTSVDFNQATTVDDDANNSYVKYQVNLGYEYNEIWSYVSYTSSTVNGITYTKLIDSDEILFPTFAVGDNIVIETANGITQPLNGLHTVLAVDGYTVTVDVPYVGTSVSPIGGTVAYADNRKTAYNNVYTHTGEFVWNGVLPWKEFKEYQYGQYLMEYASGESNVRLLTSIEPYVSPYLNKKIYATKDQDFWFNLFVDKADYEIGVYVYDNFGNELVYILDNGTPYGYVKQFKLNIQDLITNNGFNPNLEYIEFFIFEAEAEAQISYAYRIYLDKRCTIEPYEILFMDRLGSLLSYAFQLRATEKGTVDRDTFKKHVDYTLASSEDYNYNSVVLAAQGTTTYHVGLMKEYELNTNWMNDEMSVLFEELITSPYTWIKIDGDYYACTVQEKSFEVARQKNKNLIKKTVTVRLANDSVVNI